MALSAKKSAPLGSTFESIRPAIGPPTCKVCKAVMVPLFTSFYCEACERKAKPDAFNKRYSGHTTLVRPPMGANPSPRPAQVAGVREVWTSKGRALYVTGRSDVPAAWTWASWVPSRVCVSPMFDRWGDDPIRPFDVGHPRTKSWNTWRGYNESQTLRNFGPSPGPGITAALYVV